MSRCQTSQHLWAVVFVLTMNRSGGREEEDTFDKNKTFQHFLSLSYRFMDYRQGKRLLKIERILRVLNRFARTLVKESFIFDDFHLLAVQTDYRLSSSH